MVYSNITLIDGFSLAFYFKWKYFVLINSILSETIILSYLHFCVLFSNIYPKIKLMAKNGLAYASDFWKVWLRKYL